MTSRYYELTLETKLHIPETVYDFVTNRSCGCSHINARIQTIILLALVQNKDVAEAMETALLESFPLLDRSDFNDFVHTVDAWCVVTDVNDDDENKVEVLDTCYLNDSNFIDLPPLSIWDEK